MKNKILIFLIAFTGIMGFNSCDAGKRIQRICQRHPDACRQDTVNLVVRDTFRVAGFRTDTVFDNSYFTQYDTVYITKNNVIVKYAYNPNTKQVFIDVNALEQTHIFEHNIQVVNKEVTFKKHWTDYLALACTIIGGLLFIRSFFIGRNSTRTTSNTIQMSQAFEDKLTELINKRDPAQK